MSHLLYMMSLVAFASAGPCACATREVTQREPAQSPASPLAASAQWQSQVDVLAQDPPLPGEDAEHKWEGLEAAKGETAAEDAAQPYVCPMHPDVRADQPGICPRCHMTLERQE